MDVRKLAVVFNAILLICVVSGGTVLRYEYEVRQFLSNASISLERLYNEISDETYVVDDKPFIAAIEEKGIAPRISTKLMEIVKQAKLYNTSQFGDPELIKAIQRLRSADLFILGEDYFKSLHSSLAALQATATDSDICNYIQTNECSMAYLPDVRKVFSNSLDANELQFYWQEWREKQLGYGNYHFLNIAELFRKAAEINDVTVSGFWFRKYDDGNFLSNMETVMHELKPFYQEFHAYIRRELSVKYGNTVLNQVGPIPDHLIEQTLLQAWNKQSVLSHSYPRERLPNLKQGLDTQGFDISKIMGSAEDFYLSLGFQAIPIEVRRSRFKQMHVNTQDCKPDIFDRTSNVYMKYCKGSSFKRFLQSHGYLSRLHYALEKKDIPFYFFKSYDLEHPVGEAVILSASTPDHMNRAEILKDYNYTNELAMNRLFRMGVHTIFNVATHFVNTKVMVDALEGRVPLERINQYYWKLMDEYAGIEPPVDRKKKYLDFSYKFYEDLSENFQTKKFVSEILGYQMYESFCLKSGNFVPGDPNKQLHACDFYGNKDVGDTILKMMKLGSKRSWQETIKLAVGIPSMSASSLLEYYKPLYDWLKEKNRRSKTKIGWTHSSKVVW